MRKGQVPFCRVETAGHSAEIMNRCQALRTSFHAATLTLS